MGLSGPKVSVCSLGGGRGFLELPELVLRNDRDGISGGERSLYELATALAALGVQVELRGELSASVLATITEAAGARPIVGLPPRRPDPGEVVILPEGLPPSDLYLTCHLSGARPVVLLLGPPGLCGWSFLAGWSAPDLLTVDASTVGTSASFRAMDELGLTLWSAAYGIAEAGRRAGVRVTRIGTGTPVPFPDPPAKSVDIALVEANRWFPLAQEVATRLPRASVLSVPFRPGYSLSAALGPARILPWPSRVEGMSRVEREARAVGTVPIALDTNPFVTARDHGAGAVLVSDLDRLAEEAGRLLDTPVELRDLARRAAAGARADANWKGFLRRVAAALGDVPPVRAGDARSEFGDRVVATFQDERVREGDVGDLKVIRAELAGVRSLLAAYRNRRAIRLLDDLRFARAIRAGRPFRHRNGG